MALALKQVEDNSPQPLDLSSLGPYLEANPGLAEELGDPDFILAYKKILDDTGNDCYSDVLNASRCGLVYSTILPQIWDLAHQFPVFTHLYLKDHGKYRTDVTYPEFVMNDFIRDFFRAWERTYGRHGYASVGYGIDGAKLRAAATGAIDRKNVGKALPDESLTEHSRAKSWRVLTNI